MRKLFEEYIDKKIGTMPLGFIELTSGDVHRTVGGYPGPNHRMPQCCSVMYQRMSGDDKVICAPPKRKGATVTIRYYKRNH